MSEAEQFPPTDPRDQHDDIVDLRSPVVPGQIAVDAPDEVALQLGVIGRSEDVAVSPDGHRLVIAGFNANVLAIADFEVTRADPLGLSVNSARLVRSPELARPHGVTFVDDDTILVANRESELLLVDLTHVSVGRPAAVPTRVLVDGASPVPVRSPGSVAVRWITTDLFEVLVCNNYAHDVTRYLVDRSNDWRVVAADRLLAASLEIPDGIAISRSGEWIAVSNHNHNNVHLYRYDDELGPDSEPDGVLTGPNYPHGLAFAADDRCLLLADAGLPYVHAYESLDGDWSGSRGPVATTRVMDDDSFNAARHNPQEGGPKGLEVAANDVVIVTSERQPLAFFALDRIVGHEIPRRIRARREIGPSTDRLHDPASLTIARLARRVEQVEAELGSAAAIHDERTRVIEEFAGRIDDLDQRLGHARHELSAAEERAVAAQVRADEHEARAARAKSELAAVRTRAGLDAAEATAVGRQLDAQIADLQLQVELLRQSTSWRITAPLRNVSGTAKGLRGRRRR